MPKDLYQRQESGETDFMVFRTNAFFEIVETRLAPAFTDDFAGYGDLYSEELIPFPILSRARFEETRQARDLRRVRVREHMG